MESAVVVFSLGYIFGGAVAGVLVCLRMVLRYRDNPEAADTAREWATKR